jgi:uncharacterized protein (TIGR03790 family)
LQLPLVLIAAFVALSVCCRAAHAETLVPPRLGVIYRLDEPLSLELARYYADTRGIPAANLVGVRLPDTDTVTPQVFMAVRGEALARLPAAVQSLVLVWSRPYAVGCMSITTAFAAGYRAAFCEPGCAPTTRSPLFDTAGWLPADTVGWWPAMLLPTDDGELARAVIRRGAASDASAPPGTVYLVRTEDAARNVRAAAYGEAEVLLARRIHTRELTTPIIVDVPDAIGYFTGASQVPELARIHFRPGAVADHLTSTGGVLRGGGQMSALAWLAGGATGSYGTVSEPCNHPEKFPNPGVLFGHYLRGETLLEAYWKSVAMPGQGLFIGEPLARPFAARPSATQRH